MREFLEPYAAADYAPLCGGPTDPNAFNIKASLVNMKLRDSCWNSTEPLFLTVTCISQRDVHPQLKATVPYLDQIHQFH